jgi:hypothetical protein
MRSGVAERVSVSQAVSTVVPDEPEITFQSLARDAFVSAKRDTRKAARVLDAKLQRLDSDVRVSVLEEAIKMACAEAIGVACRQDRRVRGWIPPNYDAGGNGHRIAALADGNKEILMNFPLWVGGKRLKEATKNEIADAAQKYLKQGNDMVFKGRWLNLVAASVPENKKAGEVLNEIKLRKLHQEAQNA